MENRTIVISVAVGAILLIWAAFFFTSSKDEAVHARERVAEAPEPADEVGAPAPAVVAPAPAAPEPAPAPAPEGAPTAQGSAPVERPHEEQRPEKMGPFEELKASYARDGRDPEAGAAEERIRTLLKQPDIPEGMLRQVSCVKSVCKLELRWSPGDRQAYMVLMMGLVSNISQKLAAAPVGADEGQQSHPIEVYVSRIEPPVKPASAN